MKRLPRVPLGLVLIVPFVLLTMGAVGLVAYFSYRSGQRAVEDLALQLMDETGDRINQKLDDYLDVPLQINQLNEKAVRLGQIDVQDLANLEVRLWNQLTQFETIATVMFLSPEGRFRTANRANGVTDLIDMTVADFSQSLVMTTYWVDDRGRKQEAYKTVTGIDVRRDRPWYRMAVATGQPGWSPVFQSADHNILALNAYQPVYEPQTQTLLGVFSVNVSLNQLSQFLSTLEGVRSGEVFILEPDGHVIASSADGSPFRVQTAADGQQSLTRLTPDQSQSPLIRAAYQEAQAAFGDLFLLRKIQRTVMHLEGDRYFLEAFPFEKEGLNWQVVLVVPEADFMGQIDGNLYRTLLLSAATLGLAIALGLLTARWIARPISHLSRASAALAAGEWHPDLAEASPIAELNSLSQSFQQTAAQLQQSFHRVKTALAESDARFSRVFRNSPDPIAITDAKSGRFLDVNDSFLQFSEYARQDLLGRTSAELNISANPQQDLHLAEQVQREGMVRSFEYAYWTKTGRSGTALLSIEFIELEGQDCMLTVAKDISDRKQLEQALLASEARLSNILDSAIAAVSRFRVYPDGSWEIEHISAGVEAISGYTPDGLKADQELWTRCILPTDWQRVEPVLYADIQAERSGTYEYRFRHRSGTLEWLSQTNISRWDAAQNCWLVTAVTSNITTRKRTEEALAESEERLRIALDSAQMGIWDWNIQTGKITWSEGLERMCGLRPGEFDGTYETFLTFLHPEDRDRVLKAAERAIVQATDYAIEFRMCRANGTIRWAYSKGRVYYDEAGRPQRMAGVDVDITHRKQAEELLATRERYLVALAQTQRQLLAGHETPIDYALVLRYLGEVSGASRVSLFEIYPGAQESMRSRLQGEWCAAGVLPQLDNPLMQNVPLQTMFPRWVPILAKGGTIHGSTTGFPESERTILSAQGVRATLVLPLVVEAEVTGFVMFDKYTDARPWDLTEISFLGAATAAIALYRERHQAEVALQQSEATNRALVQSIPDLLMRLDRDGTYLNILNPGEVPLYNPQAMQPGRSIFDILPREMARQRMSYLQQALQTGQVQSYEYALDIAGQTQYEEARIVPCGDDTVLVIVRDVTERKQAEEQLRKTEQWLQQFSRQAPANIYTLVQNPDGLVWFEYISSALEVIQEVSLAAVMADANVLLDKIHPDDKAGYLAAVAHSAATLEPFSYEWRTVMDSGQVKWLQGRSQPERRSNGAIAWYGVVLDITEQKQIQQALQQAFQEIETHFEDSPLAILQWDRNFRILRWSKQAEQIFGWLAAEVIGLSWQDWPFVYGEDRDRVRQEITPLVDGQVPNWAIQNRNYTKDGRVIICEWYSSAVFDEAGELVSVLSFAQDISDRQRAQEALSQSEERFRSAFHAAPIGMALIGLDDRWIRVNSMLCRMLDYTEAELLSRPGSSLVHPEDVAKLNQCITETLANPDGSAQAELRYLCRGGRVAWGLLSLSLVNDAQGQPLYCVAQVQDITERRAVDRMKKEFISIVSHELRTPLTAMQGSLGLLSTGIYDQRPDKAKRMIQIAHQNSDRLVRLVNDILDLERLESGRIELVKEVCDLSTLFSQAVEGVQTLADAAFIKVVIDPVTVSVWAAPDAILQTLTNLLSNAIKFSPPQSVIHLSAYPQLDRVLVEVRDQGRGIPPDKLTSIFEKFQQVDASDSRQKGGTGLGLAICRNIIEQHDGHIWAESDLGQGSTFFFTLPLPDDTKSPHLS